MCANHLEWTRRAVATVTCAEHDRMIQRLHGGPGFVHSVVLIEGVAAAVSYGISMVVATNLSVVKGCVFTRRCLEAGEQILKLVTFHALNL